MKQRPRRLRATREIRNLVRETEFSPQNLIAPVFVVEGEGIKRAIKSMPGVFQYSVDLLIEQAKALYDLGIGGIIVFGIPDHKDGPASSAYAEQGIVQKALQGLAEAVPNLLRIADVCLCEYTDHGHCGLIKGEQVLNDETLGVLAKTAVSQVKAGAQMVAPSDMMDGRVAAIRQSLDEAGFDQVAILSYAVKYASSFYGPFREAAESAPKFGDRRTYQMDSANFREALREAQLDVEEGADILMIKPAGYYLDIIYALRQKFNVPIGAYQVSGEYSMIKAAAKNGWLDEQNVMMESLLAIKRAGADFILTYFAQAAAKLLNR